MPNYATKADLKAADVDILKLPKNIDLANLKFNVDKLNIDKLRNVQINLSSLKIRND